MEDRRLWSVARKVKAQYGLFFSCSSLSKVVRLFASILVAPALQKKCNDDCKMLSERQLQHLQHILLYGEWKFVGASGGFLPYM